MATPATLLAAPRDGIIIREMIRPNPLARSLWLDLAVAYRFLYRASLQERLASQAADVAAWHRLGRPEPPPHDPGVR